MQNTQAPIENQIQELRERATGEARAKGCKFPEVERQRDLEIMSRYAQGLADIEQKPIVLKKSQHGYYVGTRGASGAVQTFKPSPQLEAL